MIKIVKIVGSSMKPEFNAGDFVLVAKFPFFIHFLKKDRNVIFKHNGETYIKKIVKINNIEKYIRVKGNSVYSMSEDDFGNIDIAKIVGIVLMKLNF